VLAATTPEPHRTSVDYGPGADRMDVYRPGGSADGPDRPAVLLVLGVSPVPLDDERVVRVGTALARLGLVVGVPSSADLIAARLVADEPGRVVAAYRTLAGLPGVDPDRIGMAGFSVGGSLALIAAVDPVIADEVAYVNAFGSYADASTLLVDVATRTMERDGTTVAWQPGRLAREVFFGMILDAVPGGQARAAFRDVVGPAVLRDGPAPGSFDASFAAMLDGDALAAYRLATAPDRTTARGAIEDLSDARRAVLDAVSPLGVLGGIRAPVFLMHEATDDAIPVSHLAPLAEAVPEGSRRLVTEFRLFDHVEVRQGIGLEDAPELIRLYGHLVDLVGIALQ
jgi:pimeloyl-ACP methyl ester carboxylesterase